MMTRRSAFEHEARFEEINVAQPQSGFEQHSMSEYQSSKAAKTKMLAPGSFVRSWWSEFFFCIGGLVTFTIIIVVLWLYDQKSQPQWPLSITLNALLALLSTTSKASFMIAMAEVISQWKWNLHHTPQGCLFHDFTLIDLASRGFWGSCLLLYRFKWRHPLSLAALISIISVMTSPLTQQAIDYPTRPVGTYGNASVGATRHWTPLALSNERMQVEALLAQALNAGISNMPEPIDAVCPTARCTLEPYESVAMCAKVADVTSRLKVSTVRPEGDDADTPSGIPRGMHNATLVHMGTSGDGQPAPVRYVSLPNNVTFDHNYPFGVFSAVGNGSLAFRDDEAYDTALVHLYIIHTRSDDQRGSPDDLEPLEPPGSFPDPVEFGAFEVMLHFCVNEYETVVEEGRSRTSIRRTKGISLGSGGGGGGETGPAYAPPPPGGKWNMTATPVDRIPSVECITQPWDRSGLSGCFKNNYTGSVILASVNSDRREDGLRIDVSPQLEEMGHVIASTAAGLYMRLLTPQGYMSTAYRNRWSRRLRESLYGKERNITDPEEQAKRLEIFWGGVATSISNVIRTSKESDVFQGTTWDTEVYVNIRWGWLSFLAAELVLAIAFITFTAFETYRTAVPVLKSSALAASLALDGEAQQSIGSIDNLSSAEDKSKLARVRFNHGNLTLVPNVINAYNSGGIASDSSIVYSIN